MLICVELHRHCNNNYDNNLLLLNNILFLDITTFLYMIPIQFDKQEFWIFHLKP